MSKVKQILKNLGVSNEVLELTKNVHRPKKFNSVKENIPMVANYNLMADLLYLPEDSKKFKYLLVVTDLANNHFDVAPLIERSPKTVLDAMLHIFKTSHYIKKPFASISTDSGSEFKDVFDAWCKQNSIFHKISMAGRHTQQSNVESLNRILSRILNGYMNEQEMKAGKRSEKNDWVHVLPLVVKELNDMRDKKLPKDPYTVEYSDFDPTTEIKSTEELKPKYIDVNALFTGLTDGKEYDMEMPKFKVGDVVMRLLDKPKDILGHNQPTENFREGDVRYDFNQPRKITRILYMNNEPFYRYILNGFPNVSYSASELRKTKDKVEKLIVLKLSDRFKKNGQTYYKVHWKDSKTNKPSWEPRDELMKDVPDLVEAYDAKRR